MDVQRKILFNDAAGSRDNVDEETSKGNIRSVENERKIDDKSLSIMISEPKKSRARPSDVARVVFADEKQTPEVSLADESVEGTDVDDGKSIEIVISEPEDDEKPLDINTHETLREIQIRTKKHLESQPEISLPPSDPPKDDDFGGQADRESTKRSIRFRSELTEDFLAQYPQFPRPGFHRQDERESAAAASIGKSERTTSGARPSSSESLGAQSVAYGGDRTDCFDSLEAGAFAIVLQECLDLLGILEHVVPAKVDDRWDESYKTIDEKYGTPEEPEVMFREDMGLLPLVPTVSEKIQRDRTYVYNVLKSTVRDIRCLRRYDRLETEVDDIARILEGEHNLEVNNETWVSRVRQLRELIDSDRMENEEEVKNLLALAQEMNAEVDNAIFSNRSKLEYVREWEGARLDQQKLRLEMKEQEINDALGNCATMERADQIISGEVRTFLQANTRDLEEEIVAWTSRYNEEIERLQQEINYTKERIEYQKLDLQSLEELQKERQIFLDACYERKELEEREAEYWEAVNEAATLIQTLWRGYMVRHKLGEFKKLWESLMKKKKKKKSKGKKKTK